MNSVFIGCFNSCFSLYASGVTSKVPAELMAPPSSQEITIIMKRPDDIEDSCQRALVELIVEAQSTAGNELVIAMYSLTGQDKPVHQALAKSAGIVPITMIVDKNQYLNQNSKHVRSLYERVKINPTMVDGAADGCMHHKVIFLQRSGGAVTQAIFGSYNWTLAASERNYENCIIMKPNLENRSLIMELNKSTAHIRQIAFSQKQEVRVSTLAQPSLSSVTMGRNSPMSEVSVTREKVVGSKNPRSSQTSSSDENQKQ